METCRGRGGGFFWEDRSVLHSHSRERRARRQTSVESLCLQHVVQPPPSGQRKSSRDVLIYRLRLIPLKLHPFFFLRGPSRPGNVTERGEKKSLHLKLWSWFIRQLEQMYRHDGVSVHFVLILIIAYGGFLCRAAPFYSFFCLTSPLLYLFLIFCPCKKPRNHFNYFSICIYVYIYI